MSFGQQGFSFVAWVKPDSTVIEGLSTCTATELIKSLLSDVQTLIGVRWNIDVIVFENDQTWYAYGNTNRFNISTETLKRALGSLTAHVEIYKGSVHHTADQLINYKRCLDKWDVPEILRDTTTGYAEKVLEETSSGRKRPRI